MKKIILIQALLAVSLSALSQTEIRPQSGIRKLSFSNAQDSALYEYTMSKAYFELFITHKGDKKKIDSLSAIQNALVKRASGTRVQYAPSPEFTNGNDLRSIQFEGDVRRLSFSSAEVKKLPRQILRFKNLEAIELVNTNVRKVPAWLRKLPHLQAVLVYNQKRNFKVGKNKNLKILAVRGGKMQKSFAQLPGLEKLDLSQCHLTTLPANLHKNQKLKALILNDNSIDLSVVTGKENRTITRIEMKGNNLEEVADGIALFPNVRQLIFNGNKISRITPRIAELEKLEELGLYVNKLTALPEGIYNLKSLKEIDLYYNQIERLDERIGNLANLEVLYLSNNRLISVPESIGQLSQLEELYLSNNRLSDLPESLTNLCNLKVLRINNNYLTRQPYYLLKLNNIENIDISGNQIADLPGELSRLGNLKLLVLMNNPWSEEAKETLPSLAKVLREKAVIVHLNDDELK
jgi:Leucine-rich repeat (LRR) protein